MSKSVKHGWPLHATYLWLLLFMLPVTKIYATSVAQIQIISSSKSQPYQQVIASFKHSILASEPTAEFLLSDKAEPKKGNPSLVFALGTRAARQAVKKNSGQNILATMIVNTKPVEQASNASAIVLQADVEEQLKWHLRVLPGYHRIGVLYDPALNQRLIDEFRRQATKMGLEIIAVPVTSAKKLPSALKLIGRDADSLMGITDKTVYSGKTAKSVLLFSFRNRIPFIGLSRAWVKAGALYALDWDYPALGAQSAQMALQILRREGPQKITVQPAIEKVYVVNPKTVKRMKLDLPADLMKTIKISERES